MNSSPTRSPVASVLDLLREAQVLDRVPRLGFLLRGMNDVESVSEHQFHVALLVLLLAPAEPTVDSRLALEMALVHDFAELRLGDIPRPARRYFDGAIKKDAETLVLADLLAPLPQEAPARLAAERLQGDGAEARFVRACDRLALLLKVDHYQRCGHGNLDDFWQHAYDAGGFAVLAALHQELLASRLR